MAKFSKLFRRIQKYHFPPFGEVLNPREVSPDVSLTHELFKADIKHNFYLTSIDASGAGAGANIDLAMVSEPLAGYVTIPYLCSIFATGNAAPVRSIITMGQTGSPDVDVETGLWAGLAYLTIDLTADRSVPVLEPMPIPRGNFVFAQFLTVLAGTTVRARSFSLQVPIECVDWQRSFGTNGFVRTAAV